MAGGRAENELEAGGRRKSSPRKAVRPVHAGRGLHHSAVLRMLRKVGVATAGGEATSAFEASPRVKFKSAWKRQNLQVVVFV